MMRPRITIHKGIRMLVAVDIGNTNIVLGFLDGDDIIGTYRITTKSNHTSDEYGLMITTVDGETADWNVDQSYWALYIGQEYASTGADTTPVNDGDSFGLVYTIG